MFNTITRLTFSFALLALSANLAGCESLRGRELPESVIVSQDPALGREYLLYRPVAYRSDQAWPLVVACHGGWGDSSRGQIKMWRELADKYGFLVVAPLLQSGGKLERLPEDERHILSVIDHARAGQSISDDRVLMYGQGTGALSALAAAAGAPDTIRAVAVSEPRFRVEDLKAMNRPLNSSQPLLVRYNPRDAALGGHVRDCVDWLRSNGANLRADTFGSDPAVGLQRVVEFYQHVIRNEPWLRLRAAPTGSGDGLELSFQLRTSPPLQELHWQFGDGAESTDVEPIHRYAVPGTYMVRVTGKLKKETVSRTLSVRVPASGSPLTPTKIP